MTTNSLILTPDTLPIIPSIAWLSISFCILIASLIFLTVMKKYNNSSESAFKSVLVFFIHACKNPFILFLVGYSLFVLGLGLIKSLPQLVSGHEDIILSTTLYVKKIFEFVAFFWLILNLVDHAQTQLEIWLIQQKKITSSILLPMVSKSLKAAVVLLMLNILIPALGFSGDMDLVFAKAAKVALIVILSWLVVELVNGIAGLILNQYADDTNNILFNRKISTQVLLLKKVAYLIIGVITFASILMVFDSVKNLGAGLLTTAGIMSALVAFASQQSLGRIFAGLQIAFTQPIKMGDTVIVDKEQGQVEEITLSYIVVKLWDLRRLIVPSDYFTTRGLQNLTRTSTDLLGTVFFYTDYKLPLSPVREKFNEILKNSKLWDGKVSNFQVTDVKEFSIELRALVSAKDASTLWDLRCEIREKLMEFIVDHYPEYMPKTRYSNWQMENS